MEVENNWKLLKEKVRYSQRYYDNEWEYRNVSIPREWVKEHSNIENMQILSEEAWRKFIAQSKGWEHFGYSRGEPFILLFRRAIGTDPKTGIYNPRLKDQHMRDERRKRIQLLAKLQLQLLN